MNDVTDRVRQEALLVTHPRHRQVLLEALDEIERLRAAASRAAPGHTDLMVTPESLDAFLERNPPEADEKVSRAAAKDCPAERLKNESREMLSAERLQQIARKLRTYVGIYPGDKEALRMAEDCDRAAAPVGSETIPDDAWKPCPDEAE